ncbi:antirestriction protein [Salmonella enterica]|uniref:Antirestriction protein n=1 Tax=Salmonella enterica subsp. salamae serovar 42:f,g,t:-- TaxID=41518 RepID=A0A737GYW8_SALER|nr:antirestriction protein [Salmonella enterica]EHI7783784.1 antirestriction protein [Salmonella enterica]HAE8207722.1 antirestriction protein [Salmonella enterica subsp. salamae serovar 42:f,g,t:--]
MQPTTTETTTSAVHQLQSDHAVITASLVPDEERIAFWGRRFGHVRQWAFLEPLVFSWLDLWSTGYQGGIWDFHILSNGGAFLTPPERESYTLFNEHNGNDAELSTEATGIAVCLMAWNHHACRTGCQAISEHYYHLRDYALAHPESNGILRIID